MWCGVYISIIHWFFICSLRAARWVAISNDAGGSCSICRCPLQHRRKSVSKLLAIFWRRSRPTRKFSAANMRFAEQPSGGGGGGGWHWNSLNARIILWVIFCHYVISDSNDGSQVETHKFPVHKTTAAWRRYRLITMYLIDGWFRRYECSAMHCTVQIIIIIKRP